MRALIDADSIIFKCGFAVEHTKYLLWEAGLERFGPLEVFSGKRDIPKEIRDAIPYVEIKELGKGPGGLAPLYITKSVHIEPLENALYLVKQSIEGILKATEATSYNVYIKGVGNFREGIAVTRPYKGNRDKAHRPHYEKEIREYLKNVWKATEVDGQEVDDRVAIEQYDRNTYTAHDGNYTHWDVNKSKSIIVSADKDLNQIPGWHYDFIHDRKYWVTEDEAIRFFYEQCLTGDQSDNVPGLRGIGPAKAKAILKDYTAEPDLYRAVREAYFVEYPDKADEILHEQASLLWLKRREDDKWQSPKLS